MKRKATAKKTTRRSPQVRDTFTVRDMNRQPQVVLTAARTLGRVHIQGRSGERYLIQTEESETTEPSSRADFLTHLRRLHEEMQISGSTGFTAQGWDTMSNAIAGEQ